MRPQATTVEQVLAGIAGRSHGVVTRRELRRAGLTPGEIKQALSVGTLLREYRAVYRVGHRAESLEARYLAAVRACGEGAVLSCRAAGHLLGILKGSAPPPEVTTRTRRRVDGVVTHRSPGMDARDTTVVRGIAVTTVPRTLVDLAGELVLDDLARACHEAVVRYRVTPAHVDAALARCPHRRGAGRLKSVMRGDVPVSLSRLESAFLTLLRNAGLPLPETNRPAGAHRVDCRWREHRLTVELDSYRYHGSRHAWERDRRREREAYARGDQFRRYTYGDVFEDPRLMLAELRALLLHRGR